MVAFGTRDDDATVGGTGQVDARVSRAGIQEQLQVREAFLQGRREWCAFTHAGDALVGLETRDEAVQVGGVGGVEGVGKGVNLQVGDALEEFGGDASIVIQNGKGHSIGG